MMHCVVNELNISHSTVVFHYHKYLVDFQQPSKLLIICQCSFYNMRLISSCTLFIRIMFSIRSVLVIWISNLSSRFVFQLGVYRIQDPEGSKTTGHPLSGVVTSNGRYNGAVQSNMYLYINGRVSGIESPANSRQDYRKRHPPLIPIPAQ